MTWIIISYLCCNDTDWFLMKLQSLPLLLPCVASIFWLLTYLLFTQKGGIYKRISRLFIVFSFFFLFAFLTCLPVWSLLAPHSIPSLPLPFIQPQHLLQTHPYVLLSAAFCSHGSYVCTRSRVLLLATPGTVARQAPRIWSQPISKGLTWQS